MSKTKELDILVNKVTKETLEKLYKVSDFHLSHSDIDVEGDTIIYMSLGRIASLKKFFHHFWDLFSILRRYVLEIIDNIYTYYFNL